MLLTIYPHHMNTVYLYVWVQQTQHGADADVVVVVLVDDDDWHHDDEVVYPSNVSHNIAVRSFESERIHPKSE